MVKKLFLALIIVSVIGALAAVNINSYSADKGNYNWLLYVILFAAIIGDVVLVYKLLMTNSDEKEQPK